MIRAVMLVRSGSNVPKAVKLAEDVKRLGYVSDAYAVFGRFDVVVFLQERDVAELFRSISEITKVAGIMSSESLVEVPENQQSPDYGKGPFSS